MPGGPVIIAKATSSWPDLGQAFHDCRTPQPPLLGEAGLCLLDGRHRFGVDHAAVVFGQFLSEPRGRLRLQVPQFVRGASLNRQAGPVRQERRGEPGIPVDHGQHRSGQVPGHKAGDDLAPTRGTFFASQPQI